MVGNWFPFIFLPHAADKTVEKKIIARVAVKRSLAYLNQTNNVKKNWHKICRSTTHKAKTNKH